MGGLRFLLERRLIRIQGRKAVPGRPLLYGTTRYFLELFQLKDLKSLPDSSELTELELLSKGQLSLFQKETEEGRALEDAGNETAESTVPKAVDEGGAQEEQTGNAPF